MTLPIRVRLTAWYVGLLALLLAAVSTFVLLRLRADLVLGIDRSLDLRAAQIALGFEGRGEGEFRDVSSTSLEGLPRGESAAQLVSVTGTVLETSGDAVAGRRLVTAQQLAAASRGGRVRGTTRLGPDREPFRLLAARLSPGHPGQIIVVATSLEEMTGSVHRLLVLLLLAGPTALAAATIGGWLLARRALAPVSEMTRAASAIEPEALGERVHVPPARDELGRLAETLNSMLDRIERAVTDQQRLVGDASHELRTPLAIMRAELDVSLRDPTLPRPTREAFESNREEVERMTRIVENLLVLAQLDEGRFQIKTERIRLRDLVGVVVTEFEPVAQARQISVSTLGDGAEVVADPRWMHQVVRNLVDNALKYSSARGQVAIELWDEEHRAGLTVRDAGPGITAEALPRIFDRFYRVDPSRSREAGGSGLGLAIVKDVVEAQGGTVWAESEVGRGSSFFISLPTPAS